MFPKTSTRILKTMHFQNRLESLKISKQATRRECLSGIELSSCENSAGTSRGIRSVLRPSLVAGTEGRKRVEHKCTRIVDVRCVARALTCLEIHPFFFLLSLSPAQVGQARVAEGMEGDQQASRVNTAYRSSTHKYTVSQRVELTRLYMRIRVRVPPHPEDTATEGEREREREKLSIFPAAFATSRKPRFLRKNTRHPWA